MLSTGEKTNPVPLETLFLQDLHVAAAVMFGRGRFQNGVLIQPEDPFEPGDTAKLTAFRNAIWQVFSRMPTVEKVNNYAPTHSRIFKEMIIVTRPSKPFEYTPKGTPRRQVCIAAYEEEIEALYAAVKESSQPEIIPPAQWTVDSTLHFIRNVVEKVVLAPLTDDTDFFQVGCDSLQATWIRNTILRSLRATSGLHIHKVPFSFVYNHPTIRTLSAYVFDLVVQAADTARGKESGVLDSLSASAAPEPRGPSTGYPSDNILAGSTLEKLVDNGGLPLILIHGGSGNILSFLPLMQKMKTSLWALQLTEEVPLTTVDAIANHYFEKIKAARPHGPYRLGAYCVTGIILFALAKLFEANGDQVAQLSVIESFPLLFTCTPFEPDEESIRQQSPTAAMEDRAIREIAVPVFDIDSPSHLHVAKQLIAALDGQEAPPFITAMLHNYKRLYSMICEFIFELLPPGQPYSSGAARRAVIDWLAPVQAPVTTFVASEGIIKLFPEWDDLGTCQAFPNARVVKIPSNHYSIFESDILLNSMQHWGETE
ncbi:Alpha/Beta hydrolase protein [Hygrophoropsis aurantiaca]|uniref:Alpha/Beta hydrolase protein n=1 Tax=Hygrophoropsis aurantiaca TaxID=72124 RepID=A0ACB8AGN5_9AGAM|nr:Alpha/Beta hydrolase protein [Hygrophoropsis aurantiaca]